MLIGIFKCRSCSLVFKHSPGPIYEGCPSCGHIWLDWLNWEEIVRESNRLEKIKKEKISNGTLKWDKETRQWIQTK